MENSGGRTKNRDCLEIDTEISRGVKKQSGKEEKEEKRSDRTGEGERGKNKGKRERKKTKK